jgi:hypothetical protein
MLKTARQKVLRTGNPNEQYHLYRWLGRRGDVCAQHVGVTLMSHIPMTSVDTSNTSRFDENERRSGSYVDWSCVLGGAILASAISSLLFTFGSGLGLSLLSPWPSERMNGTLFGVIMIIWTVFVPLLAFALGGYFAGRLRRPWQNLSTDEVMFRDGAHGALVWATSIVIGAALLAMLAMSAANVAGQAAGSAVNMAASPTMPRMVDELFRTDRPIDDATRATRDEAQRLVGRSGSLTLSQTDQTYLSGLVARATGLTAADADQRVSQALIETRAAAETARKAGIVAAFFAAATMLLGLAVAWFAAKRGGEDRDKISVRVQR